MVGFILNNDIILDGIKGWQCQGFRIYLYFRLRHSFAHVWKILNKMASFSVNIYRPSASEDGQNITNITMILKTNYAAL